MTAHELARKLLELPNLPVVVYDVIDLVDLELVTDAQIVTDPLCMYWDSSKLEWSKDEHIQIL